MPETGRSTEPGAESLATAAISLIASCTSRRGDIIESNLNPGTTNLFILSLSLRRGQLKGSPSKNTHFKYRDQSPGACALRGVIGPISGTYNQTYKVGQDKLAITAL